MEMEEAGFLQRHPWLVPLLLLLGSALVAWLSITTFYDQNSPPEFAVSLSSYEGLDVRSGDPAAVPPALRLVLRVKNYVPVRRCFSQGSAVVDLNGVPLARADRFDGFCVPAYSVREVPFVAAGGWLGLPDQLYHERVRSSGGGGLPSLGLRVRLDGGYHWAILLRCTATLDGRTSPKCPWFDLRELGSIMVV